MKVIPAILVHSQKEFEERLKKVAPYADAVQIDVMDGRFVPNATWADAAAIAKMKLPVKLEAHLMVKNPELGVMEEWAKAGAFRIIFHFEATKKPEVCIKKIKKYGCEAGMAINPTTQVIKIKKLLSKLDYILVMGVDPGFSGQNFQPIAVEKIRQIRQLAPKIKISVDGGVSPENAKDLYAAGADYLCAATSIFQAKNIKKAIAALE
jgi:ribulose-phosphate 3-epimerase